MGDAAENIVFDNLVQETNWVKPPVFSACTGYSLKAMEHKRLKKQWPQGIVWDRVGGEILFSIRGYNAWVEQNREIPGASGPTVPPSRSPSTGTGNASPRHIHTARRQLT